MRSILHIRIEPFFVLVERNRHPELAGRPVIVGRAKGNTSGVVVSASKDACKCGVKEGMSVRQAQRSCPEAAVLKADHAAYRQVSEDFMDILSRCSPLLEPDMLGNAYMDVTGSRRLFGSAARISGLISAEVSKRLNMPAFIGCGSNRLISKIASGAASDSGKLFVYIGDDMWCRVSSPMPVNALDPINERIEKRLHELGVSSIGQLAAIPEHLLIRQFGPIGSVIRKQCSGIDSSVVKAAYPPDIIIIEHPFAHTVEEPAEAEEYLNAMAGQAHIKLRKRGALAGEITLNLQDDSQDKSQDKSTFHSAYLRFKKPTDSVYSMQQSLAKLLHSIMNPGMQISRMRISLSDLTHGASSQMCLFGDGERKKRLNRACELIRERFGDGSVFIASSLSATGRAGVLPRIAA